MKKLIKKVREWHNLRQLVTGSTDQAQLKKLLEEFMELSCSIYANKPANQVVGIVKGMLDDLEHNNRIKADDGSGKKDAIGDMIVVLVNIAERNDTYLRECLAGSYNEIKDRKGLMKNGIYVKYEDLSNEEKAKFK